MRKLITGLIVGLLIGTAGTAIAANSFVEAQFAKFNIQVNDDEPVEVEALVHEGVSNYPIRVIADMLDHEVGWIDETRTIKLYLQEKEGDELPIIEDTTDITQDPEEYETLDTINEGIKNARVALDAINRTIELYGNNDVDQTERLERKAQLEDRIAELEVKKVLLESQQ